MNVPFKLGNLGIGELVEAKLRGKPVPDLPDLRPLKIFGDAGFSSMEDYVPWHWVEPKKGEFRWERSDHNLAGLARAGMQYSIYPFLQFVPDWLLYEPDFQGFVCLEHNTAASFPSVWAPSTLQYYDRYYQRLAEHFGAKISHVYAAGPADFGEIAYPTGAASDVWKTPHMHEGWWIGDRFARESWAAFLEQKFQTVKAVNARWGTSYVSVKDIEYPKTPTNRLQWLDFMEWYRSSLTDFTIKLVKIARKHFPSQPFEIKIGHPYEKLIYGTDVAKLTKAGSQLGFGIRSTAAGVPPEVYRSMSKLSPDIIFFLAARFSTVTNYYHVPFVTEEPDALPKEKSLPRIFIDASSGVSEVFMGPSTYMQAKDYYQQYGDVIRGTQAESQIAFYYPLTDHLLKPEERLPQGLFDASNVLRDMMNYDIVDDEVIDDGILGRYQFLVFFDRGTLRGSVLKAIEAWVNVGGVLIHPFANQTVDVIDGDASHAGKALFEFSPSDRRNFIDEDIVAKRIGRGGVVAADRALAPNQFYSTVVKMLYRGNELFPWVKTEPIIDPQPDKVYTSRYKNRVLFYNAGRRAAVKKFMVDPANFPGAKEKKELTVTIEPATIMEVQVAP